MKISKTIQTPEGPVTFDGELSGDEADMVIGLGLNYLLQQGALPFKIVAPVNLQPTEGETQQ
ncbi:MAG: hypothetical protein NUV80_07405 [Candidatus Berkelbacteria bacterium]|nr:hypothetical protein [Candidatus Berkelbacteria bacterium]